MKLSCLPVSLFGDICSGKYPLAKWAKYAQSLGLDGYDVSTMFFPNHTPAALIELKAELADIDIPMLMATDYPDFTNPDANERRRQLDFIKRNIALISCFGVRYMRITAGMNHPGMDFDAAVEHVVECFADIAPTAESYGVELVFENHAKPGAWPIVDFSFDPRAFFAVCERMKGLPIGVNFDTANACACGEKPDEMLKRAMPYVKTIHMNDTSTVGYLTSVLIGTGLVNFDDVFRLIDASGFNGWVCIEEAGMGHEESIRKAVEFARKYVR